MKKDFLRIISPMTLVVTIVLDIAVAYFAYFAVMKLLHFTTKYAVFFAVMEIFAILVAILVTKNVLTQGIIFSDESLEFTALDENNIVKYEDIESFETQKDDKASLVKNFVDRQSKIIFTLKDGNILTVDIGLTTKKTLKKASNKISEKLN